MQRPQLFLGFGKAGRRFGVLFFISFTPSFFIFYFFGLEISEIIPIFADRKKNYSMEANVLNEAQLSILRLLGSLKTVEEVNELRQVICDYYARRVDDEVDKLWESGEWDNAKNEAVLNEHLRTPYKHGQ